MHYKGFWISMVLAMSFYIIGLPWLRNLFAFFLPLVLWGVCFGNAWWGSKIVSWVAFTVGFISWMTVLGAFAIRWRVDPGIRTWLFARALVMYGALWMAALYQLKGEQSPSPQSSPPVGRG